MSSRGCNERASLRRIIDTGVNSGPGRWRWSVTAVVEPDVATYQQYIDGEWTGAEDGRTYGVINPSTEEVMAVAPASSRASRGSKARG